MINEKDYEELKQRLLEDGLIVQQEEESGSKRHEYFRKASDYVHTEYRKRGIAGYGASYQNARRIVVWAYGCRTVAQMPDDKRDEANQMLIDIMSKAFDIRERER